ncbi:lipopolysaccharide biosynthesis protein [Flexivirga lutea]
MPHTSPATVFQQRLLLMPAGTVPVGLGLAVFGASSYLFLAFGARQLSPADFAALSALWVLVYTGGPGVFLPFEQAIGRAVAAHRADPVQERRVVRALVAAAAVALLVLLAVAVAFRTTITDTLFDGSGATFVALLLAAIGMWAAYLMRGVFAGHNRYGMYGVQLGIEGMVRVAAGLTATVLAGAVGGFSLGLAAALVISVLFTLTGLRGGHRRPVAPTMTVEDPALATQLRILGWMVLGGLMMQVLVNVAPLIVKVAPGSSGAAGHYLGGLMLARLPLFLFAAVQAALLPGLAHTVADGDRARLARQLRSLLTLVTVAMGAFTLLMAVAGPQLVRLVYGDGFRLGRTDLVLMAAGTAAAILAMVVGAAVIAVGSPAASAFGWTAAVAVLALVLLLPGGLFLRLELSYLAGSVVALVIQLAALVRHTGAAAAAQLSEVSA